VRRGKKPNFSATVDVASAHEEKEEDDDDDKLKFVKLTCRSNSAGPIMQRTQIHEYTNVKVLVQDNYANKTKTEAH
jgi:hypothetical protein